MAVLFIFGFLLTILFNSNLINGAEMGHSISLDPNQTDFSQNRMLQQTYRVTCPKRNGNKPCRLNVNTDDSYVISIERGVLFEARFLLESQNSDLNISFISNSPLQPDISVYYGSRRPEYISQIGSSNAVVPKSFIQAYDGGTLFFDLDGFDQPITLTLRMTFIASSNTSSPTSPPSTVPSTSTGGASSVNSPSKTSSGSSSQQYGSQDGYLSTEEISGGSLSALIIIIPIAATIMLLCILGIWCYRNKANRQRRNRFAQAQRGRNDRIELILEESEPLTQQNITERFPVAKGEMLENPFGQTTCSICLEEFQKESACRQLYCQHIFHSECIKLWLINQLAKGQAFCPNCNKSVMKKADIEIIRDEI